MLTFTHHHRSILLMPLHRYLGTLSYDTVKSYRWIFPRRLRNTASSTPDNGTWWVVLYHKTSVNVTSSAYKYFFNHASILTPTPTSHQVLG
jgi:hypothetical protein